MRRLAFGALALVIFQGLLGGLRVVLVSLDLAVVHACVAQLYFALLAAMALFTSAKWDSPGPPPAFEMKHAGWLASGAVFIQIILGALLRHPGTGIDPLLAGLHMGWAFVALLMVYLHIKVLTSAPGLRTLGRVIMAVVTAQITLGFVAYFVLLDEAGVIQPSNLQVIINSLHLIVGAVLFATNVVGVLATRRTHSLTVSGA
jgi:cytochrome c oxidase assembly protein subunit 15